MQYVRPFADETASDAYGTAWGLLKGSADGAPRLMLEAHADEIGMMVQFISEKGFVYVNGIGGVDRAIVRSRRVRVLGSKGDVPAVVGNTAIHLRKDAKEEKMPEWHELFIDVGAGSREEVEGLGIRVGHPVVFEEGAAEWLPGRLVGRALDNRVGGFIIAEVLRALAEAERPACTVVAVNAVQEEIGGHGARMVTHRLRPAVAVVLDVTHATDTPGIEQEKHGGIRLGGGPTVIHGSANHPRVVQALLEAAERESISVQHEASSRTTGTDTDDVFVSRDGVPAALISLPMRYMHSTVEMVDLQDVERCIRLLTAFARWLPVDASFTAHP